MSNGALPAAWRNPAWPICSEFAMRSRNRLLTREDAMPAF